MNKRTRRLLRHPLFWWTLQQLVGVWVVYDAMRDAYARQWLAFAFDVGAVYFTTRWRVPPLAVAARGKWFLDDER